MLDTVIASLLVVALLLAVVGAVRRVRLWQKGRPAEINYLAGLASIPRRYLVDLHDVVARDRVFANTHVATAGGFVAVLVLSVLVYLFSVDYRLLHLAILLASAGMLTGTLFVWKRRNNPPANLSTGAWSRLPKSLLLFSTSFLLTSLVGVLGFDSLPWVFVVVLGLGVFLGLAELVFGMTWGGPMKHAFAGALHLGFHPRPERFSGGQSTGLKTVDLASSTLGVGKPSDFKWNQLLGFDACVQCGRCEKVCPAFAAGQPLNPKKLIQDMVTGMAGGSTESYSGSAYPGKENDIGYGAPDKPLFEGLLDADTVWSCTTCRACVEECPMMIEHVDAVVDMRRYLTLEQGKTAGKGIEALDNLIATDNPNGNPPKQRANWAVELNIPLMADVAEADVLLWAGDGAFDLQYRQTLSALVVLLRRAKVDFAILGNEELDCGDLARRLGDEATFQRLATANIKTLGKYSFRRIVTPDPHAFHVLKNEYPDLGGSYQVQHHSQILAELAALGAIRLETSKLEAVTYHDPCYLGRYNGGYYEPRYLLEKMGIEVKEMERSGYRSRCCGGGGGAPVTDIPGKQRIPDMRMEDVKETGAEVVVVACPQCSVMLEGVVEPRPQVRDIAILLRDALAEPDQQSARGAANG